MDFGTLLHVAKKNSQDGADKSRCYSTKFAPPKKECRDKKLSANIQKFLAKKEQEEKQKEREKIRKRDELLAMRDTKSKNKINKMLKVIKSANKSAIADAVDTENTAITLQGPDQPDEDDYGYVSQEASAFYKQMMDKYKSQPEEDKFAPVRRKASSTDVRKAPREATVSTPSTVKRPEPTLPENGKDEKPKMKKPPPPPVDFASLLKLAEKKQHEPIEIVQEVKKKEDTKRPMTQKEKEEFEREQALKEAKRRRMIEDKRKCLPGKPQTPQADGKPLNGRIPKLGAPSSTQNKEKAPQPGPSRKPDNRDIKESNLKKPPKKEVDPRSSDKLRRALTEPSGSKKPQMPDRQRAETQKPREVPQKPRELPPKDVQKTREFPPKDVPRTRDFPPKDIQRSRQFPPPDLQRSRPRNDLVRKPISKRPRIEDDDSEYDSEMDDFIDDGPEGGEDSYSKHIREIFGYDKSRYRDEDFDDRQMESTFAQQMREEFISKKIGLMEDLEDMKQEQLEKEMKAKMKSKKQKT
ncbi:hypothetical protein DMENIID0001_062420 [Sergentomyia squamirostris]